MRATGAQFWTEPDNDYGAIHWANVHSEGYRPSVLLVFVHGIFSSRFSAWGNLPELVLRRLDLDLDIFSFEYPSKLWQKASISRGADDLQIALESAFRHYRTLVLIGHSTGGLVIKRMLCKSCTETIGVFEKDKGGLRDVDFIALRSRRIINITVPHSGGQRALAAIGNAAYRVIYPLLWPLCKLVYLASGGRYEWGHNDILRELRWHNPALVELETNYIKQIAACDELMIPRPVSVDIMARGDLALDDQEMETREGGASPFVVRDDAEQVKLRGGHGSVKLPKGEGLSIICDIIADQVRPFGQSRTLGLARVTAERGQYLDRDVRSLVGNDTADVPQPRDDLSAETSQRTVCAKLSQIAREGPPEDRSIVVTGEAGVGKSVVVRTFARRLALRFLNDVSGTAALPLVIPLQQFTLTSDEVKCFAVSDEAVTEGWNVILKHWCHWATDLLLDEVRASESSPQWKRDTFRVDQNWVGDLIRRDPVIVILDGVDEFLAHHDGLDFEDVVLMVEALRHRHSSNDRLVIVMVIRGTTSGLLGLGYARLHLLEVRGMTETEAVTVFPDARAILRRVIDPGVRKLLLTPLVLTKLGPGIKYLDDASLQKRTAVLEAALLTIIERLRAVAKGQHIGTRAWLNALTLVGWRFSLNQVGEMSIDFIQSEAEREVLKWKPFLDSSKVGAIAVAEGFDLLLKRDTLRELMDRSIFFPTGRDSYRFSHREWEDFLAARYAALTIRYGKVRELAHRALNHDVFVMAGEQLEPADTSLEKVREIVNIAREPGNFLVLGNFAQILADSAAPISGNVLALELLDKLDAFPEVVCFAMLSGLGARVLLQAPNDPWVRGLRRPVLEALIRCTREMHRSPLIRSMAWCYVQEMCKDELLPDGCEDWPGLWSHPEQESEVLRMIATAEDGRFTTSKLQESIQAAFLRIQRYVLQIPKREISAVHYLYPLVVAHHRGIALDRHVFLGLPSLLNDPQLDGAYSNYASVPMVKAIWKRCRELFGVST